jgi:N-acetylneuraminic acid mutarotase
MRAMRRTLVAGLVLAFSFSALGGNVLAQADPEPSPSSTPLADPAAMAEPVADSPTVDFVMPAWRKITPDRSPPAREDHTWTVDEEGRFAYLFGGRDGSKDLGDLWRFDLTTDTWKKLSPKGKTPAPRFGHSAVWVDGYGVVVFAGQRGPDFFDDLWVYDPESKRWRELPAKGSVPKRRYGSCMIVGPDGRLWISHGFTFAGRFDDTRAYNLKSERWATITPDGRKPGERCLHDCFTSAAGELVLYGGQDDGSFALGDLWVMSVDRKWDRREDPKPKPRRLYAVTEAGDYAYVFGGAGQDNEKFADLWRVDRETLEFERVSTGDRHPAARYATTLITDAKGGRLLLFAGQASSAKSDVWELVEATESAAETPDDEGAIESPLPAADEDTVDA